jgi:hypothetical protein
VKQVNFLYLYFLPWGSANYYHKKIISDPHMGSAHFFPSCPFPLHQCIVPPFDTKICFIFPYGDLKCSSLHKKIISEPHMGSADFFLGCPFPMHQCIFPPFDMGKCFIFPYGDLRWILRNATRTDRTQANLIEVNIHTIVESWNLKAHSPKWLDDVFAD